MATGTIWMESEYFSRLLYTTFTCKCKHISAMMEPSLRTEVRSTIACCIQMTNHSNSLPVPEHLLSVQVDDSNTWIQNNEVLHFLSLSLCYIVHMFRVVVWFMLLLCDNSHILMTNLDLYKMCGTNQVCYQHAKHYKAMNAYIVDIPSAPPLLCTFAGPVAPILSFLPQTMQHQFRCKTCNTTMANTSI